MTFTKANGAGWGSTDEVTITQINKLDSDIANALDNSTAGDTATGNFTFVGPGGGSFAGIYLDTPTVSSTAGSITIANTGTFTVNHGSIRMNSGSTFTMDDGSLMTIASGGTIVSNNGFASIKFDPPLDRSIELPLLDAFNYHFCSLNAFFVYNDIVPGYFSAPILLHDGATLHSVTMYFTPANTHGGVLPDVMPSISIRRARADTPTAFEELSNDTLQYFPTPAVAATYDDYTTKQFTYTCDKNNVIDAANYYYKIDVNFEAGANAKLGASFWGMRLSYTNINDLRFQ